MTFLQYRKYITPESIYVPNFRTHPEAYMHVANFLKISRTVFASIKKTHVHTRTCTYIHTHTHTLIYIIYRRRRERERERECDWKITQNENTQWYHTPYQTHTCSQPTTHTHAHTYLYYIYLSIRHIRQNYLNLSLTSNRFNQFKKLTFVLYIDPRPSRQLRDAPV